MVMFGQLAASQTAPHNMVMNIISIFPLNRRSEGVLEHPEHPPGYATAVVTHNDKYMYMYTMTELIPYRTKISWDLNSADSCLQSFR